ncbi:50S ribosomal protein L17 [Patescibacteria group bacterium]|nr:50S ribosomal protein L17 [Patescibacteria group bacterium]
MRKNVFGKQLSRDKNERKALFKNLMSSLVLNESIKTTEPKAKAIKSEVDKLVAKARKEERLAKKLLEQSLFPKAVKKMILDIAPRFNGRNGGYTRIVKLGKRFGDDASVVLMEWVEKSKILKEDKKEEKKTKQNMTVVKKEVKAKTTKSKKEVKK